MKKVISVSLLLALSCLSLFAGKIEKKVTIGRKADCKGLAFNCSPEKLGAIEISIQYQASSSRSLTLSFRAEVVQSNEILKSSILNNTTCFIEEDWELSNEILQAIQAPKGIIILKGRYKIEKKLERYDLIIYE